MEDCTWRHLKTRSAFRQAVEPRHCCLEYLPLCVLLLLQSPLKTPSSRLPPSHQHYPWLHCSPTLNHSAEFARPVVSHFPTRRALPSHPATLSTLEHPKNPNISRSRFIWSQSSPTFASVRFLGSLLFPVLRVPTLRNPRERRAPSEGDVPGESGAPTQA